MSARRTRAQTRLPEDYPWWWWAADMHGHVAHFDAGTTGPVPSLFGMMARSHRGFERAALSRHLIEQPPGYSLNYDTRGLFESQAQVFDDPGSVPAPEQEDATVEALLELRAGLGLSSRCVVELLREGKGQHAFAALNAAPLLVLSRSPAAWLRAVWSELGICRALLPYTLELDRAGVYGYVYDDDAGVYQRNSRARGRPLQIEALSAQLRSRCVFVEGEFHSAQPLCPRDGQRWLTPAQLLRSRPRLRD